VKIKINVIRNLQPRQTMGEKYVAMTFNLDVTTDDLDILE